MKTAASLFIGAWLVLQFALPVSYYVDGGDPLDERFAWRMFSPSRMVRCQADLYSGGPDQRRNDLIKSELTMVWRGWLARGRLVVANEYLATRCRRDRAAGVAAPWASMELTCFRPDGTPDVRLSRHNNGCGP